MPAPTRDPMLHSEKFTDARGKFSLLFDEAVQNGLPVVIERGRREQGVLMARDSVLRILSSFQLHVDVLPEVDGSFTLWLRELDTGGTGPTLKEARDDLVSTVRSYVRDYWQQFALYRYLPICHQRSRTCSDSAWLTLSRSSTTCCSVIFPTNTPRSTWSPSPSDEARPSPEPQRPLPDYLQRHLRDVLHWSDEHISQTTRDQAQELLNDYYANELREP